MWRLLCGIYYVRRQRERNTGSLSRIAGAASLLSDPARSQDGTLADPSRRSARSGARPSPHPRPECSGLSHLWADSDVPRSGDLPIGAIPTIGHISNSSMSVAIRYGISASRQFIPCPDSWRGRQPNGSTMPYRSKASPRAVLFSQRCPTWRRQCVSARGPDADWQAKVLMTQSLAGSHLGAYSHTAAAA